MAHRIHSMVGGIIEIDQADAAGPCASAAAVARAVAADGLCRSEEGPGLGQRG